MTENQTRLLTPEDLAQRLGLTRGYVIKLARGREIEHIRLGRHYRFTEDHINAFLDSRRRPLPTDTIDMPRPTPLLSVPKKGGEIKSREDRAALSEELKELFGRSCDHGNS